MHFGSIGGYKVHPFQFDIFGYLFSGDQQDLMFGLLQALLGARDLDVVAGVVGSWDLDFGGSLEL